jgi:hypothetical protein
MGRGSGSVSELVSVSTAASAGGGTAGVLIGTDTTWFTAITRTSPTAVSSAIIPPSVAEARASIIPVETLVAAHITMPAAAAPFMAAGLTARIPAHSAASITEATCGHFPLAAGQASAGASMVVEVTAGEVTDENGANTTVNPIQGV